MNRFESKAVVLVSASGSKSGLWHFFAFWIRAAGFPPLKDFHLLAGFLTAAIALPTAALAQSSGGNPVKWPDQTECRNLLSSDKIGNNSAAEDLVTAGWCIAIDDRRGNCVACHSFNVSPWPVSLPIAGNLAPPMVAMRARFPDSASLRGIIEDVTTVNPRSSMPPYLKHGILSAQEIDQLIAFLGTL